MKTIELTRGKVAIVDDADFEYLNQWNWYASKAKKGFYAQHTQGIFPFKKRVYMHRLIMNAPDGFDVDHINGNELDNRRSNLRLCNRSENMGNIKKHSDNTSGYKGVYWRTDKNKWCAVIKINYKTKYLGYFVDVKEAARAYDIAAKNYFGKFANLNFPENNE